MGRIRTKLKYENFIKNKSALNIFFIVVFAIIAARHFIGLHFEKKFSVRPAPGVIVSTVERSIFLKALKLLEQL